MIIQQSIRKPHSNIRKNQVWDLYGVHKYQRRQQNYGKQRKGSRQLRKYPREQCQYTQTQNFDKRYGSTILNNQDNVFLKRYKIVPSKNKSLKIWNRKSNCKSQKSLGLVYEIKYKKINKNSSTNSKKKSQREISNINYSKSNLSITKNNGLTEMKQIQRTAQSVINKTKVSTMGSISTKTVTQLAINPYKEIQQFNNKGNQQNYQKQSNISFFKNRKQNNIKILPQQNSINVIVQQSSQSKLSKSIRNNSFGSRGSRSSIDSKTNGSLKSSFRNSIFLPLNSLKNSNKFQQISDASQLEGYAVIQNYLELLTILANYAHEITQNYQNTQDWEELIFLTYKKYYLYRLKLFNALFYRNTLFFQSIGIKLSSSKKKSLKFFMNSQNGQILRKEIYRQNLQIADSLRNIYNLAIQKSGNYINLVETDNFSCQIFRLMAQQIQQLQQNYFSDPETVKNRLKIVMKCALAIAKLDGKFEQQRQLNKLMSNSISMKLFENLIKQIKLKLV